MSHDAGLVDATLAMAGHRTAQAGSLSAFFGWATTSNAGVVVGMVGVIVGLLIQWYYNRKRDKREMAEHKLKMTLRQDQL